MWLLPIMSIFSQFLVTVVYVWFPNAYFSWLLMQPPPDLITAFSYSKPSLRFRYFELADGIIKDVIRHSGFGCFFSF